MLICIAGGLVLTKTNLTKSLAKLNLENPYGANNNLNSFFIFD